jgi:hypothetical protein
VQKYHNSRFCERNRFLEKENCVKMFKFGKHCRPWQAIKVSIEEAEDVEVQLQF